MKAGSNAAALARKYAQRVAALNKALERGLKKAASTVDREQVKNLSGSGADEPGSYPVPVRKGTLRGGHGWAVRGVKQASIFNTTVYAMAIHKDRPFLDDAAEKVDAGSIVAGEVSKAFAI